MRVEIGGKPLPELGSPGIVRRRECREQVDVSGGAVAVLRRGRPATLETDGQPLAHQSRRHLLHRQVVVPWLVAGLDLVVESYSGMQGQRPQVGGVRHRGTRDPRAGVDVPNPVHREGMCLGGLLGERALDDTVKFKERGPCRDQEPAPDEVAQFGDLEAELDDMTVAMADAWTR